MITLRISKQNVQDHTIIMTPITTLGHNINKRVDIFNKAQVKQTTKKQKNKTKTQSQYHLISSRNKIT